MRERRFRASFLVGKIDGRWKNMRYSDVKTVLTVTLPIVVAQLSTMGINFINTMMAGHSGADDLAGVSVGVGLFYPFEAAVIGLLMAGTPIIGQLWGAKKTECIPSVVRTGLYMAGLTGVLFIAGYFLFMDSILAGMALEPTVHHVAKYYILAMVGTAIFVSLIIPLRALTDIIGGTAISMRLFLLALPIDAVLNYFFIFGHGGMPRLGGIGAGVSSAITYAIVLALFLFIMYKDERFMGAAIFSKAHTRLAHWKEYLDIGIPAGLSVLLETGMFGAIILFMAKFGTETLAAYQIADNFANMAYMIPLSCSMALTILVARAVGAKDGVLAKRYARTGIILSVGFSLTELILTILLREYVSLVYTDDMAVVVIASHFLIYASFFQFFDSVAVPIQGILRGYKDTKVPFFFMLIAYWGVCLPLAYFLDHSLNQGAVAYWIGLVSGVGTVTVLMTLRYVLRKDDMEEPPATPDAVVPFLHKAPVGPMRMKEAYDHLSRMKKHREIEKQQEKEALFRYSDSVFRKDLYEPQTLVIEIYDHLLTRLERYAIGRATRGFIP